jgi:hypothetical protein
VLDYGISSEPVSDWLAMPTLPGDWQGLALSQAQVDQFDQEGFLSGVDVLTTGQVESLCSELGTLMNPSPEQRELFYEFHADESDHSDQVLFHALGAWRVTPRFHDILWAPQLRVASFQLLGGVGVRFLHDQLFCKPAGCGGAVAWHQDYSYWTWTQPMAHVTCWIALDDVDEENGCLWYVPGSHLWPDLPITGLTGDMDAVRSRLNPEQLEAFERRVPVVLRAGQAAFHHPRTMHGSYQNRSKRQRRATLVNTMRDGVRSAIGDDPRDLRRFFKAPPDGALFAGTYFPLLFEPGLMDATTPLAARSAWD